MGPGAEVVLLYLLPITILHWGINMLKNVASQKIQLFAFIPSTGLPKTGDAANLTAYVSKDHGTVTVLADTSATEMDATNAKGVYVFDLAQGETNADELTYSAKSSTSDVSIVPRFVTTYPATGILAPATLGRTLVVDASGLADANTVKIGPTGSGVAQTARDIGASVLLSNGTGTGQVSLSSGAVKIQTGLKKAQQILNFPFLMTDDTNHNPVTGLTVTVTRSLDGAAFGAGTIANIAETSNGWYQCDLLTGDTNGDTVALRFTATGADDLAITLITEP